MERIHKRWPNRVDPIGIRRLPINLVILALMLLSAANARGSEFGVSTYRPGLMDLFAGYLAPPGTTLEKTYFLFQDASETAAPEHSQLRIHSHTITYTAASFAAHVTRLRLLGSYWAFGVIAQTRLAQQTLRIGPVGTPGIRQNATVGGFGDLIVSPFMLSWAFGHLHLSSSLMLYAPTGSYDPHRIINIGTNRWAVEPDFGLTWFDEESGSHASLFVGYTINSKNTASHYLSGQEFHADFVLAQHLRRSWILGVAGYALQQTTPDSGSGAVLGAFKGRVLALGPLIGKTIVVHGLPINLCFKYDFEFASQNRSSGNELWLTAALRF